MTPEALPSLITRLARKGMPREIYDEMRKTPVGFGETVEDFIQASIDLGQFKWSNDRLVFDLSKLTVHLNEEQEEMLRAKAVETGKSPAEVLMEIVSSGLQENRSEKP